ncbi:hypothetical protein LZD49_18310 [Dyadobacter sp. CY261]|uniref:hypothetical protein n=1 Tax=Dyadobacter sp. CY261 TaxID=2907203 RepID=UPI001F474A43|nr:hypothetical protein [Dyadobacter sp. CY261]MCF0072442.1 hypothetical protein [Dyadobacter sp. CY261]
MTHLEMFLVKSQWLITQQNNHIIRQNLNLSSALNSIMTTLSHISTGNGTGITDTIEEHVRSVEASTRLDMESWSALSDEMLKLARLMDLLEKRN